MELTIYTYGSLSWMTEILRGISDILGYSSGEAFFGSVGMNYYIGIAIMVGFLVTILTSMRSGGNYIDGLSKMMVNLMVFLLLFAVGVDVRVYDAKDTDRHAFVEQLPAGMAIPASLVSSFSRWIAHEFALHMPSSYSISTGDFDPYSDKGFLSSLQVLNSLRDVGSTPSLMERIEASHSGIPITRPRETIERYVSRCTLTGVAMNDKSMDEVINGVMPEALRWDSEMYSVEITPGNNVTCTEAWNYVGDDSTGSIFNSIRTTTSNEYVAELAAITGALDPSLYEDPNSATVSDSAIQAWNDYVSGAGSDYNAEGILQRIANAGNELGVMSTSLEEAQRAVFASIAQPVFYEAQAGNLRNTGDVTSALMIQETINQRNTRWAASQALFMNTIEPMSAMMESFIWIIVPFISGAILMGFGLGLLGRLAMILASVSLWMPVLIVIDRFTRNAARQAVQSNTEIQFGGMSKFYTMESVGQTAETWIGVGGAMAAATPMIAMMLMTGSQMAAVSMANKLGGTDNDVDVDKTTPKVAENSSALKAANLQTFDSLSGAQRFGGDQQGATFTFQDVMGREEARMATQVNQATSNLGSTLSESNTANWSADYTTSVMDTFRSVDQSALGEEFSNMGTQAEKYAADLNATSEQQDTYRAMSQAVASGGLKLSQAVNAMGKYQGTAEWAEQNSSSIREGLQQAQQQGQQFSETERATYGTQLAQSIDQTGRETFTAGLGEQQRQDVTAQVGALQQQSDQYAQTVRSAESSSAQWQYTSQTVATQLSNPENRSTLDEFNTGFNRLMNSQDSEDKAAFQEAIENRAQRLYDSGFSGSWSDAENRAKIETLADGQFGAQGQAVVDNAVLGLSGSDRPATDYSGANNDGIEGTKTLKEVSENGGVMAPPGGARDAVLEGQEGMDSDREDSTLFSRDSLQGRIESGYESDLEDLTQDPEKVRQQASLQAQRQQNTAPNRLVNFLSSFDAYSNSSRYEGASINQVGGAYTDALDAGMTRGQAIYAAGLAANSDALKERGMSTMKTDFGGDERLAQDTATLMSSSFAPGRSGIADMAQSTAYISDTFQSEPTREQYQDDLMSMRDESLALERGPSEIAGNGSFTSADDVLETGIVSDQNVAGEIARINSEIQAAEDRGGFYDVDYDVENAMEYQTRLVEADQLAGAPGMDGDFSALSDIAPDFTNGQDGSGTQSLAQASTALHQMQYGTFDPEVGVSPDSQINEQLYQERQIQAAVDRQTRISNSDQQWNASQLPFNTQSGSSQLDSITAEAYRTMGSEDNNLTSDQRDNLANFFYDMGEAVYQEDAPYSPSALAAEVDPYSTAASAQRQQILETAANDRQEAMDMIKSRYLK